MKVLNHLFTILALFSAIAVGVTNYINGESCTWQFIALLWILNSYVTTLYIARLEDKNK